jgi:hypothetical protein
MKLLLNSIVAALAALTLTTAAFAQADSTMRRSFTPASRAEPVTPGGSAGWSGGTLYRAATPGAPLGSVEDTCNQPGKQFQNNTAAAAGVWVETTDSGTYINAYSRIGGTWSLVASAPYGSTFGIVPARTNYCVVSDTDRVQWRVGAYGDGLLETDYVKPVSVVDTAVGICNMPEIPSYYFPGDPYNGTGAGWVPAVPAYSTTSYKRTFGSSAAGAVFAVSGVGPFASTYSALAGVVGASSCR